MRKLTVLIEAGLSLLGLVACGFVQPYAPGVTATPTQETKTLPVMLPEGAEGFFLVNQGKAVTLPLQSLSEKHSLYLANLPATQEWQPVVLVRQEGLDPEELYLWQMVGSVGLIPELDKSAGGMRVKAVRTGFGAETGGLQAGDLIVSVEDQSLKDSITNVGFENRFAELLTGDLGTHVRLTVQRGNEQIELSLLRNFPTLLSIYRPLDYDRQEGAGGVLALTPRGNLPEGMYCYQPGGTAFYCFLRGEVDLAQPTPVLSASQSRGADTQPLPESANFQPSPCRFPTPAGQEVTCGDLSVPEDRNQPDGKSIQLHVAIFHSPYRSQPDPVIYLHGGPGASALEWIAETYASGFQYLFPERDLIVFDQRGVGYSQPPLECLIPEDYASSLAKDERFSLLEWGVSRMPACQGDLTAKEINLAAYNTVASAADLHDLIQALGYAQVNLFGQSYGTRLALTYLENYGAQGKARSIVLDGVSPPGVDLFGERGKNAQRSFQAIFNACAADPICNQDYPSIEQRFYSLLERLKAEPVTLEWGEWGRQPVVVNDYRLIEALFRTSYYSDQFSMLPALLASFEQGDYRLFRQALENVLASAESVDHGVYFAVLCGDASSSTAGQGVREALAPALQDYFRTTEAALRQVCDGWPTALLSQAQDPTVKSDVPTLLLSGAFDPVTPPAWAEMATQNLTQGYVYISPAGSHDLLAVDPCAQMITTRFIQDLARPEHACLDEQVKLRFTGIGGN